MTEWNELSEMNVRVDDNMAVVTGVNHVKGKDDKNQPFDIRVLLKMLRERVDGGPPPS